MSPINKPMIGVTGATGFIGKQLVERLLKLRYSVKALVLGANNNLSKNVQVVRGNLVTNKKLEKFLEGVDILVHLAARLLPPENKMYKNNVVATDNLIESAKKYAIKKIIFMSTAVVYGEGRGKVFTEVSQCKPNTEYGRTKLLAEKIVLDWAKKSGGIATIFRPFNIYGPGNLKGVIYNFYKSLKDDRKVTIYGTGEQTRNFLFIDDAVEAILLGIKKDKGGIFNLASPKGYSIKKLLRFIERLLNRKVEFIFQPLEKDKVQEVEYSFNKARNILRWRAKVSLEEGLKKTFEWYSHNL